MNSNPSLERIRQFVANHPDAGVMDVLGQLCLPPEYDEVVAALINGNEVASSAVPDPVGTGETSRNSESSTAENVSERKSREIGTQDSDGAGDDGEGAGGTSEANKKFNPCETAPADTPDSDSGEFTPAPTGEDVWADVDFTDVTPGVWPPAWAATDFWMTHKGNKLPFAPWGDRNAPAECTKSACATHFDSEADANGLIAGCEACRRHRNETVTCADCDHDARWKWGYRDNWASKATADEWVEMDPEIAGHVAIISDADPFAFVDGDDVRDPETDAVHPAFIVVLEKLGLTYADVSTSDTGNHALYVGELPDGVSQVTFDLDDEPWGSNDDVPSVEIYDGSGQHVCVATGRHVAGTPTEVRVWDDDGLAAVLDEYGPEEDPQAPSHDTDRDHDALADYEPTTTHNDETTEDIRDVLAAVDRLRPHDISLRTRQVGHDATGWEQWDPSSYRSSAGNDSLHRPPGEPVFHDQKTGRSFGVLSLFAAEQDIINKPWHSLRGEDWRAAVEAARDAGAPIPKHESPDPDPVSALPLARLDRLDYDDARRYARKRGMEWPTTDEARNRLDDRLMQAVRHGEEAVIDAPTALGKSTTVARTPWGNHADATGGKPVVQFSETRKARDGAAAESRGAGDVTCAVLRGRDEACPVAAGKHDPATDDEDDDPDIVVTIDGQPASKWLDAVCDGRGVPFSTAHAHLADHNDQGIDLPCCAGDAECPAKAQWEGVPTDEDGGPTVDVIHATHQFAHVPSLRRANVILDECPDFTADLTTDRVQRAVTAYLRAADAPVTTWEAFVQLAQHDGIDGDAARERDATQNTIQEYEPDREWYLTADGAHTLAPALTRAIWFAFRDDTDANARRAATVPHAPPRLDAAARDDDGWNRSWVTVVLDDTNRVRTVRAVPDFSNAGCVIGLDAHPCMVKWQRNATPGITADPLLGPEERSRWRRFERRLTVVQVGDNTNPLASGNYFAESKTRTVLAHLHDQYGARFSTAITSKSVERDHKRLMREVGITDPETMHFGEEKSRNDFAGEDVGLVNGSIDPGDDHILDLLAECDLDARPETVVDDDGTEHRARGRGFVGPNADAAADILASVRENHVAQSAGRYARNADNPDDRAVVFVRTDALPPGFADLQVPGVEWVATDTQREVIEALRDQPTATAAELAAATDVTKRHVAKTLARLVEDGAVECRERAGDHGAHVYRALAGAAAATTGLCDLDPTDDIAAQIANDGVWESYTWAFAITPPERRGSVATDAPAGGGDDAPQPFAAFSDGPPPE